MPSVADNAPGDDIGVMARQLYIEGPALTRFIQHHRHRICPVGLLAEQVPAGSSVLDIGCGGGLLIARLAALGRVRSALGIDPSEPAIRMARSMKNRLEALAHGADIEFEHRLVQDGLPDRIFDVVCLVDVLHHVPVDAQERAFHDAASRVRPGGVLVYKDMCDAPFWRAGMNRLHDLAVARQWIHSVPVERVESWGRRAGLSAGASHDVNILWYGHELRVFHRPEQGSAR